MNTGALLVLLAALLVIGWIVGTPLLRSRRRTRQRAEALTEADRMYLRRRVPLYRRLPDDLRVRLEGLIRVFLAEKEFIGCQGLAVTPHMRLTIAAQACLLVAGRDEHVYDDLLSILVYPSQFVVAGQWHDDDGIVTEEARILSGQAWDVSRIILSWEDVQSRGQGDDAYNVVIHEFAHYLDHEAGGMVGTPAVDRSGEQRQWAEVFQHEFAALRAAVDAGAETFLDPYASEDEAEFFAVASEAFFEAADRLQQRHPALYAQLAAFYRLDPAAWL